MTPVGFPVAAAVVALVALRAAPVAADAYETSVSVQPSAGAATVADAADPDASSRLSTAGGSLRFTWATRDWLAWEVESYGLATGSIEHTDTDVGGSVRDFRRRVVAGGLDAGGTLRLGARFIPTATLAVGPQLRIHPEATGFHPTTGLPVGPVESRIIFDIAARASAGFDVRLGPRWVAGARASIRQGLGLGDGSWRSFEGMVHLSYYWYARIWVLPRRSY